LLLQATDQRVVIVWSTAPEQLNAGKVDAEKGPLKGLSKKRSRERFLVS